MAVLSRPVSFADSMRKETGERVLTREQREVATPSGCPDHPRQADETEACRVSFLHFLRHWKFVEREHGVVMTFAELWPGQEACVAAMETHPWLFMLKAGKLGFTELECAFDGWVARFRQANARVHLFSMNDKAAMALLEKVRFGLDRLPEFMRLPIQTGAPGGDTASQIRYVAGTDDIRTIVSYPAVKSVAIDQTATHSHVDELARMAWPEDTWSSIQSTIAGSVHVVTRGAGDMNYTAALWRKAQAGETPLFAFFTPWDQRPREPVKCSKCARPYHRVPRYGVDEEEIVCEGMSAHEANAAWYAEQEASLTTLQLYFLAPRNADEALSGDDQEAFVPMMNWDACYDASLPSVMPGDPTPCVLSLDAGVKSDYFAAVLVSRHPARPQDPAIRARKVWRPEDFANHAIDLSQVENWIRGVCLGMCVAGHPNDWRNRPKPVDGCAECQAGNVIPGFNIVQICFDPHQLLDMMQRLARDEVAWTFEFDQGERRLLADQRFRTVILQRKLAHTIDPTHRDDPMRQHVANAAAQIPKKEDHKLRIVKRGTGKIDLAVAASMGCHQVLELNLE